MSEDPSTDFLTLLTTHDRALSLYVYGLVPIHADADDILQQTKMVMWRSFSQFIPGTNFIAWARKIAFHQILGYRRRSKRVHIPLSEEILSQVGDEISRLSDHGLARREALESCLHSLPSDHRKIILLRYFENLEVDEIANRTGTTVAAVYRALSRLRYTLLECIESRLKTEETTA